MTDTGIIPLPSINFLFLFELNLVSHQFESGCLKMLTLSFFIPSRPVDGYRTLDSGYRAPSRQQIDPYAAQPQVMSRGMRALGSALEMRYGQGIYGLEDDQRSVGYDDYGMGPPPMHPGGYGTMPRLGPGPGGMDRRRLR